MEEAAINVLAAAYKVGQFIHHDSVARKHYQEGLSPARREYYQGKADAIRQIMIELETTDLAVMDRIRPLVPNSAESWRHAQERARSELPKPPKTEPITTGRTGKLH